MLRSSSRAGRNLARLGNFSGRTTIWLSIAAIILLVITLSCGGEATVSTPTLPVVEPSPGTATLTTIPSPTTVPSPTVTAPTTIPTAVPDTVTVQLAEHDDLGAILVDGNNRTLYLRTEDERNQSNCDESCIKTWPPLLTINDAVAGEDLTEQVLKSIKRVDGSNQVTYNGWPLYYFAGDETSGDAKGQNSGDIWFVVSIWGGPKQNNAIVSVSDHPELGTILTGASNRTLYLFTVDDRNKSNCLHGCAMVWPPLLTVGDSIAVEGIADERLDTVTRSDGSEQVTYNGWPLYYYAFDPSPGDTTGQNSGEIWYVVSAYGGPIQTNVVVQTSDDPELGPILTSARGRTVYLFTLDERNNSRCSGVCALARPPLLTVGSPMAEEGVTSGSLDSIKREDGYNQVTYDGQPLYYYAPDETPGDITGQGIGDVWFVVSPEGQAIATPPPTPMGMEHPTETPDAVVPTAEPSPTAVDTGVETPSPTSPPATALPPTMQLVATIEATPASRFYPSTFIVLKDVPLTLVMTRLYREHVNRFTIEPFIFSRSFATPGNVIDLTFTPDQSGQFKMRNVGHFFDADFIVADSVADAKSIVAQRGMQEFSLIYDFSDGGSITPDRVIVQKDIPVKVYNLSLEGKDQVSINPFYVPEEVNVVERKVTSFEFIPNVVGAFSIRNGEGITIGTLIVE